MRLKELREQKGLTQAELGRRIRISPSCVSQVESGDRRPWPNFRKRVSKVLGVSESEIFDGRAND